MCSLPRSAIPRTLRKYIISVVCSFDSILSATGVEAGKFLRVRKNFARISPILLEKFLFDLFCLQIFSHKDQDLFQCDLQNKVFMRFCANVGRHFLKSPLAPFLPGISGILPKFFCFFPIFGDFANIFKDFARIFNNSKLLWVHTSCTPTSYTTTFSRHL